MKLTGESKLFLGIIALTITIIGLASAVLTKPSPTYPINELILKNTYTKGDPNAKVVLVEFSDFQCPACLAVKPTVDALLTKYQDKLYFAYRNFPLDQHPFSHKAAQAAEAAGIQGKYWEMFDLLFKNQKDFSDTIFSALAAELSLNISVFEADMKAKAVTDKVAIDIQDGVRFGVNATPSFFLNGKKLDLASFDDLTKVVDEAVKSSN